MLRRFLQTLRRFCHAEDGRMMLFDPEQPRSPLLLSRLAKPQLVPRGKPADALILDPHLRTRYPCFWSVPLAGNGRVAGVLQLAFSSEYPWLPRELELLDTAAERCLRVAEKARLLEDLAQREHQVRQLSEHMMQIEEEERRRISRELHDETGQSLRCIRLKLEMLGRTAPPDLQTPLSETRRLTERTITEIRRIIGALSPAVLEQLGLAAALRQLATRFREIYPGQINLHLPRRLGALTEPAQDASGSASSRNRVLQLGVAPHCISMSPNYLHAEKQICKNKPFPFPDTWWPAALAGCRRP